MSFVRPISTCVVLATSASLLLPGCGGGNGGTARESSSAATSAAKGAPPTPEGGSAATASAKAPAFAPIRLGGDAPAAVNAAPKTATRESGAEQRESLLAAMMPLQIMLGQWRGTTQREFGDFKAVDEPEWVWDFQSDRDRPAMVMTSAESRYFRQARLTYVTDEGTYRLTTADKDGKARTFEGRFTQPPLDVQGDDKKLHRTYKLELTETNPDDVKDQWQVLFNQVENNRYLFELSRKRSGQFQRFDTVGTQRQGTSFALNDEDYGDRKCIISGGLGTIQVSYQGQSYWVCCTGCQAAFNDDPATWIAEFEAKREK